MPQRLLRPGILTSEAINKLSPQAELFYRRLMSVVDDWGRFEGRVTLVRIACYPLQLDRVRETDVERWMAECLKLDCMRLYTVKDQTYLQMMKWDKPRAKKSVWPNPAVPIPAYESMCGHMRPDTDTDTDTESDTDARRPAPAKKATAAEKRNAVLKQLEVIHANDPKRVAGRDESDSVGLSQSRIGH